MKKLKLYLETSVWNFLFADDAPEKKIATEAFFAEIDRGGYSLFISEVVINEIFRAPAEKRKILMDEIERRNPNILDYSMEARDLVSFYLGNSLLTENHIDDLSHAAIASVNEIDILVSWNLKHLVKRRTRAMVNALNRIMSYHDLDICTPEEVF